MQSLPRAQLCARLYGHSRVHSRSRRYGTSSRTAVLQRDSSARSSIQVLSINLAKFSSTKFSLVLSLAKFSLVLLLYLGTAVPAVRALAVPMVAGGDGFPCGCLGSKQKRVKPPLGDFQAI